MKPFYLITATLLLSLTTVQPATARFQSGPTLAQSPTVEDRITDAVYLNQEGLDQFNRGESAAALAAFNKALVIFQEIGARAGEAQTLSRIGNVYHYQLRQYDQAMKVYQQALAIQREVGDRANEWITLDNLGELHSALDQHQQALEFFQQALAIVKSLKDSPSAAIRHNHVASAYIQLGQYEQALESYQQALTIYRQENNHIDTGATLSNMGVIYGNLGRYAQATESYQAALDVYAKVPAYWGARAVTLNNLAGLYFSLGQYTQALETARRALMIFKRFNKLQNSSDTFSSSLLYDRLGRAKPLELKQQGFATRLDLGSAFGRDASIIQVGSGATLNNIGRVYFGLGQNDQALQLYEQALSLYKEIGDRAGQGVTLNNIGQVYASQRKFDQALKFYQQALTLYKAVGDRSGEGVVLSNLGQVYANLNQYGQALQSYQQALVIHREVRDRPNEGITLKSIGFSLFKTGQLAEAESTLRNAAAVLESLRPGLADSDKVSLFETQAKTYGILQQILVIQNKWEAALEIAERSRARAFVDLLAQRLSDTSQPTAASLSAEQIKQVARTQQATIVQYSIIDDELQVQGQLQTRSSKLFIWVIQPTGTIAFRQVDLPTFLQCKENQPCSTSLEELVFSSRESIGVLGRGFSFNENVAAVRTVIQKVEAAQIQDPRLKQLYQLLIQPIADLLPRDPNAQVVIVPQKSLFLVPFVALQDANNQYLIQQHTLRTAPAIQVLDLTYQQRQRQLSKEPATLSAANVLIVGNPTMPSLSFRLGEPPQELPSLPGAEREAKEIAALLNTQALTGSQANKAAVLRAMSQAKIIHLATHGLIDDFKGLGVPGAIALGPSGSESGLLTASEILNLNLNAELVVLSACDTGRGRITGDGVIGLSRSLISAGVPSVIVSLWKVPDEPTASLMTEFYQNLQSQRSATSKGAQLNRAQALRQAMLKTMQQYPDPLDWAAFTLIGVSE